MNVKVNEPPLGSQIIFCEVLENELVSLTINLYLTCQESNMLTCLNSNISDVLCNQKSFAINFLFKSMHVPLTSLDRSVYLWGDAKACRCLYLEYLTLRERLSQMKSPGCVQQKYLRSYDGIPPLSNCVLSVIKGIALLPEKLTSPPPEDLHTSLMVMYGLETGHQVSYVVDIDFVKRYQRLFLWVVEDDLHLRLIMAQCCQLEIRSCNGRHRMHNRCVEALKDLIDIRNGKTDCLTFWA